MAQPTQHHSLQTKEQQVLNHISLTHSAIEKKEVNFGESVNGAFNYFALIANNPALDAELCKTLGKTVYITGSFPNEQSDHLELVGQGGPLDWNAQSKEVHSIRPNLFDRAFTFHVEPKYMNDKISFKLIAKSTVGTHWQEGDNLELDLSQTGFLSIYQMQDVKFKDKAVVDLTKTAATTTADTTASTATTTTGTTTADTSTATATTTTGTTTADTSTATATTTTDTTTAGDTTQSAASTQTPSDPSQTAGSTQTPSDPTEQTASTQTPNDPTQTAASTQTPNNTPEPETEPVVQTMGRVVKVVAQLPMSVEREVTLRGAGGPLGKWDSDLETDDSGFSSTKIFSIRVPETQKQCVLSFKLVKDKANWETGANHIVDLRQYSEDVVQIELSGVKFG